LISKLFTATLIAEYREVFNKVSREILYSIKSLKWANNFQYKEFEECSTHEPFLKILLDKIE
jgi:hypothetical protein